jgi:N utilization substance protein B
MASYRHLARIAVMQTLFSYEFRNEQILPDLESNCREFSDKLTDLTFAHELLDGVLLHKQEIRDIISKEAPEWPFERIALADRVVLEMGIYEILFSRDVPPVVAINEAIEISKVFGDLNSSKFINGVLSTIMNKYQKKDAEPVKVIKPATAKKTVSSKKSKTISPK